MTTTTTMKMMVLLVPLAALLAVSAAQQEYCRVCSDHTLCKFPTAGPGPLCKEYRVDSVTRAQQDAILKAHNDLRNRVALGRETRGLNGRAQPAAANMRRLVWDSELATIAQRWASQCNFEHDTCRNAKDGQWTGQNLYWEATSEKSFSGPPDYAKVVQSWYDEVKDRDGSLNTRPFKAQPRGAPVVGHFTQVAWADTARVGCGTAQYKDGSWTARIVACNYKTGGNIGNRLMYEAGNPASKCPTGTRKDAKTYPGLCA